MLIKSSGIYTQVGVLHGAIEECDSSKFPSIFNSLQDFYNLKWIKENAEGLLGKKCYSK